MRKQIVRESPPEERPGGGRWLDLERHARVEITSEDPDHPIESALVPGGGDGWRASEPGEQRIRLLFDEPRTLQRVHLVVEEREAQRTQELSLSWLPAGGGTWQSLVRQQYTFSPPGTTREVEEWAFDVRGAAALELSIVPDISRGEARASLAALRLD